MKEWEKQMRYTLEQRLPNGEQELKIDNAVYTVSKNTYIGYQIAVVKEEKKMWKNSTFGNKAI